MQNNKPATKGYTVRPQGAEILDSVSSYLRRYLVCDEHQLTILTLWSASTHCPGVFSTAAYLDIRSPEPYSGKSVCFNLLNAVCRTSWYFTGAPGATMVERFLPGRSLDDPGMELDSRPLFTVLLDDCHHSFSRSERQPIVALLNSGSDIGGYFPSGEEDYNFFGPKAFAGNSPLPCSLAARSIPIILRRSKPSEKFTRLEYSAIQDAASPLADRLKQWTANIRPALAKAARSDPANLPPTLSPGQRKCAEPLIHIADFAGGSWPAKARAAVAAIFDIEDASLPLQMLSDVRSLFRLKDNPAYIATADLLIELRAMETRSWSDWGSKSGRRLGTLLRIFEISSRYINHSGGGFRGYHLADFQDSWERYLPPLASVPELEEEPASPFGNEAPFGTKIASETSSETRISAIGAD